MRVAHALGKKGGGWRGGGPCRFALGEKTTSDNAPISEFGVVTTTLAPRPAKPAATVGVVVRAVAARLADRPRDDPVSRALAETAATRPVTHEDASRCARLLLDAGLLEEAETIYEALARLRKWEPAGQEGLALLAMARRRWSEALAAWDALIAAFAPRRDLPWVNGRANALSELDRAEEAADLYAELAAAPAPASEAKGRQGLAQLAMRRSDWAGAIAHWDELLERFAGHPSESFWRSRRALALLRLGRSGEAESALRELLRDKPGMLSAFLALLQLLVGTGRHDDALREIDGGAFRVMENPGLIKTKLRALIRLKRFKAARMAFERLLAKTDDPALLAALFEFTAPLYEGWPRTEIWLALQDRVERLIAARDPGSLQTAQSLGLRLRLALRDYDGFLSAMNRSGDTHLGAQDRGLRAVAGVLDRPSFPDWQAPKVFGIGLSKTGTTSLTSALAILDFNTAHFINYLTGELLGDDDLHIFDALTDTPICVGFEKYFYMFPNAKFIYTVRSLEDWESSVYRHWLRTQGVGDFKEAQVEVGRNDRLHHGVPFRDINHSLFTNHASFAEAYGVYDRRVRRFFEDKPPDRFLEFDIFAGHGWPDLCAFLGRAAPDQPFPWQNRGLTGHDDGEGS